MSTRDRSCCKSASIGRKESVSPDASRSVERPMKERQLSGKPNDVEANDDVQWCTKEFRDEYEKKGKYDLKAQVPFLAKLADHYLRRAQTQTVEPSWVYLLKAHSLFNSCYARNKDESWRKKAFQVQRKYWDQQVKDVSYERQRFVTKSLEDHLTNIHADLKDSLSTKAQRVIKRLEGGSWESEELTDEWIHCVEEIGTSCNEKMVRFMGVIVEQAVNWCGTPPVPFATACIGSMARGEATPYSDVEFLFLLGTNGQHNRKSGGKSSGGRNGEGETSGDKTDVKEYFELLAVTTYFLIGNLGETNLKYMAIKELAKDEWFVDSCVNGFKIDGLKEKAGNIPTGNGQSEQKNHFIATVDEMFIKCRKVYQQVPDRERALTGDLSAMLASIVCAYGDVSIVDDLQRKLKAIETTQQREEASGEMLSRDSKNFRFQPDNQLTLKHDVKKKFFRYPTLITYDYKIVYNIDAQSTFDVVREMGTKYLITQNSSRSRQCLAATGIYLRLAAYLHYNSQREDITVVRTAASKSTTDDKDGRQRIFKLPKILLHYLMIHAELVSEELEAPVSKDCWTDYVEQAASKTVPLTHFYCYEYREFLDTLPKDCNNNMRPLKAKAHMELGEFSKADAEMKQLPEPEATNLHGDLERLLGQYQNSITLYKQSIKYLEKLREKWLEKRMEKRVEKEIKQLADTYEKLGLAYTDIADYKNAHSSYENALCHRTKEWDKKALRGGCLYSNSIRDLIEKEKSADIATTIWHIGSALLKAGKIEEAQECMRLAREMRLDVFDKVNHPDLADSYHQIALAHSRRGNYGEAMSDYETALDIRKDVFGDCNHPDIAQTYNNMGSVSLSQGKYEKACNYYEKAQKIREHLYEGDHPYKADSIDNIGVVHYKKGENEEALICYEESLEMRRRIYANKDHPDLAVSYNNMGTAKLSERDYKAALDWFLKALEMRRRIFGKTDHYHIADDYYNIGCAQLQLGRYESALASSQTALKMWGGLYEGRCHRDIRNATLLRRSANFYKVCREIRNSLRRISILLTAAALVGLGTLAGIVWHTFCFENKCDLLTRTHCD